MAKHRLAHDSFPRSTRVSSGTYDQDSREVVLVFPDGVHWYYRGVSPTVWKELIHAPSAGAFLRERLDFFRNGPA